MLKRKIQAARECAQESITIYEKINAQPTAVQKCKRTTFVAQTLVEGLRPELEVPKIEDFAQKLNPVKIEELDPYQGYKPITIEDVHKPDILIRIVARRISLERKTFSKAKDRIKEIKEELSAFEEFQKNIGNWRGFYIAVPAFIFSVVGAVFETKNADMKQIGAVILGVKILSHLIQIVKEIRNKTKMMRKKFGEAVEANIEFETVKRWQQEMTQLCKELTKINHRMALTKIGDKSHPN